MKNVRGAVFSRLRLGCVVGLLLAAGCATAWPERPPSVLAFREGARGPSASVRDSLYAGRGDGRDAPRSQDPQGPADTADLASEPDAEPTPDDEPPPAREPGVHAVRQDAVPRNDMSRGVSLERLLDLAARRNPTVLQARSHVAGVLGKAEQAGLWPNPIIGYTGDQIGVMGTAGELHGGFVRQEIVTAGKRRLSREKYEARTAVAEHLATAQLLRVANDVRIEWWRTVGANSSVELRQEFLENAEDVLLTTREELNVGQANRAELHVAVALLEEARLQFAMAQNVYAARWSRLLAHVGADLPLPADLDGNLDQDRPLLDALEARERLLAESPEIAAAKAKLDADRITVLREEVEPIPNVFVEGLAGYNFVEDDVVAGAQVFLEVPIFDRNQGTIRQARADLVRQRGEVRRVELRLLRDFADRYERYLSAYQHVRQFERVVLPEARQAYDVQLQSYEEDRVAWREVLDAERRWIELRLRFVDWLVELRVNEAAIDGFLLVEGLDAPRDPTPPGHIDAVPQPR